MLRGRSQSHPLREGEAFGTAVVEGDAEHVTEYTTDSATARRQRSSSRDRRRAASRQPAPSRRAALLASAIVVGILVLGVAVDAFASAGRVHPGVSVGGVSVGGKTPVEAMAKLKTELPAKAAVPVEVAGTSKTWSVVPKDIGASFDYVKLTDGAMEVGRSGGFFASVGERFGAWFGGRSLPAPAIADKTKLDAVVGKIASAIDVAPKDAVLTVSADAVKMKPSATGVAVDRPRLVSELLGTFTSDATRTVTIRTGVAQPHINDAAAQEAKAVVETMMAGPAKVQYESKSWTLSEAELAKMVRFESIEATGQGASRWHLMPVIGAKEASKTIIPKVGASLGNPPKDARFVTRGGKISIEPSKDGVGVDVVDFAANLTAVLKNPQRGRTVQLRTKITPPKLTTEAARDMGITKRISTFTTDYSSGAESRVNNIHLLGDALDGKLVAPGATFSFNEAVGERTAAKGYQEANAIVKGKLVPQLGGGICQVATTLFNTVFLSGFPVVERENHSFYISHYPTGRDATVSWGGPDLRWKNPTSHWVLVSVGYSSDSITVSLYGTDPGYDVSYETGKFTNIVPFKKIKEPDPTLQVGLEVVKDPGVDGKKVVVTRTVKKGGQVVRTDTFTSNYTPKSATVRVGTKAKSSKTASSTVTPKKP
jgi:vancomycin resistance protein YoaR